MHVYHEYLSFTPRADGSPGDDFRIVVPERFNFAYDVVDRMAAESPDQTAMVWVHHENYTKTFTFADMKRESDRAAAYFQSLGIKRGDPVMLVLKRHYSFWFCIMGLHKLGAVTVPATHLLTTKDFLYRFNAASVKAIVCCEDYNVAKSVEEAGAQAEINPVKIMIDNPPEGWHALLPGLEKAPPFHAPPRQEVNNNEDLMLLYFTSGTTGMPKMVAHNFTYPLGHILTASYWQCCFDGGLHLTIADTGWAKSVWGKLYGQWMAGSAVFTYEFEKFQAADILQKLQDYKVTTFCCPPTMYRFMIQEDLSKYDLSAMKHCVVAGEALHPEVYEQWRAATGLRLYEGFGQTETTLSLTTYPWMEPKPGSMGKPSMTYDVDLVDENDVPVPNGTVGEIVIRTDKTVPVGVFAGYYRDPDRTAGVWHDGIYHTGDIAWRDESGYYWYVGRMDDIIKSSGYRIGPFEVESVLMEHPAVVECAVTGAPDPVRGQVVRATIVLGRGYTAGDELAKEIQNFVKQNTAPYKYPRIVEFVEALPKTISGKIRRVEIRGK
ncbi:MAG: AMP-binding protein [Clostridia bacterium]|nr:AMP-binding protein [Clostridia bacterium]